MTDDKAFQLCSSRIHIGTNVIYYLHSVKRLGVIWIYYTYLDILILLLLGPVWATQQRRSLPQLYPNCIPTIQLYPNYAWCNFTTTMPQFLLQLGLPQLMPNCVSTYNNRNAYQVFFIFILQTLRLTACSYQFTMPWLNMLFFWFYFPLALKNLNKNIPRVLGDIKTFKHSYYTYSQK